MILDFIYAAVIVLCGLFGLAVSVVLIAAATIYLHKE